MFFYILDKMKQLQDVLANLHITSKTSDSCEMISDDTLTNHVQEIESYQKNKASNNLSHEDLINGNEESKNLKINMPPDQFHNSKSDKLNLSNKNDSINYTSDPLSPNSIWSRTRESKLDLSTASSNESEHSPFKFNELLHVIDDINTPKYNSSSRKIDGYSSDSEDSSFHSGVSSLKSSIFTAEEGSNWIYLLGRTPTDIDRQVYELIKDINVDQYPSVKAWKILMETYTVEQRERWVSYEKEIKNISSELIMSQSNIINDVKSKLLFDED